MSKYIPGNQKHLTLEDRIYIENSLNKGRTFKGHCQISVQGSDYHLQRSQVHIACRTGITRATFYNAKNFCVRSISTVKKTNACGKILVCGIKCTSCPTCNQTCPDFQKERCSRLDKAPYVCNGCDTKISHCTIAHKYNYDAHGLLNRKYREKLSGFHDAGINMTKRELHQKDMIITPLIEQGQSPYQIATNHPELDHVCTHHCTPISTTDYSQPGTWT